MGRKIVLISLFLVLLCSIILCFSIIPSAKTCFAQETGTVYIRADGSIDPSTASISTFDNITYTLSDDINDSIVIERDNIVVDGAGCTVEGTGSGNGITLSGRTNVTIKNMMIKTFGCGILLTASSSYNSISGNNITTNSKLGGIVLDYDSGNSTISGNRIANNEVGISLSFSLGCIISENNITGNYGDGISQQSSSANSISGNNIASNGFGVGLDSSSGNVLSGNNVTNNKYGIELSMSSDNSVFYNNFVDNTNQVDILFGSTDFWDNGSWGNYWSDYPTKYWYATEIDDSGVWNTPYIIDTQNIDHYPLTAQYAIPELPSFLFLLFMIVAMLVALVCRRKHFYPAGR